MRITSETCPECHTLDVKVEHVIDGFTLLRHHLWHCPTCGDHYALVAYDCPHCPPEPERAQERMERER